MGELLKVEDLRVSYHSYAGEVQSVRGVSFAVDEGETLAIVGESGCGKSVTARSIMGLIQTPPGEVKEGSHIWYKGKDILKYEEKEWRAYRGAECSIIFQDALTSLNPTIKVGRQVAENLLLHQKMEKGQAWAEAERMLGLVGIPNPGKRMHQYPHEFSGGMRQRVMIAIALACSPQIVIADEPTTALDVTIQADIIELLKKLQNELTMAIILITHDLGIVANMAKKIVVMYAGKIMEEGSDSDIFYHPKHPYTKALLKAVPRLDMGEQELSAIDGMPPDIINPPQGCPFYDRCSLAMCICEREEPPSFDFGQGHKAKCWLYHPMAGYTEE